MTTPIICTSERLRKEPKTECVAKAIFAALDKLHVEHRELKNTQDYWCRDFSYLGNILEANISVM